MDAMSNSNIDKIIKGKAMATDTSRREFMEKTAWTVTAAVVAKAGYDCPVIVTPQEFLERMEEFGYED